MTKHKRPKDKKRKKDITSSLLDADLDTTNEEQETKEDLEETPSCIENLTQKEMKAFTNDLMTRFERKMEESLLKFDNQLKERLSTVENIVIRLDKQYSEIREEVKAVTFKADKNAETISHFENEISQRDKKIEQLALEIDDLRNRGMRKTLIIKGIPEGAEGNDSSDKVKAFIISFLETHAGISGVGVPRPLLYREPCLLSSSSGKIHYDIKRRETSKELFRVYSETRSKKDWTLGRKEFGIFARRAMVDLAREGLCYQRKT